jgi:CheY-like chemotaxis protein
MYQLAVVDDNETWCFVIAHLLHLYGYKTATFTDVDQFMREAARFDLALVDFSMPPRSYQSHTDGPDVIRRVKQQLSQPPLMVLVSAYFTEDLVEQAADVFPEADAYLSKDLDSRELIAQIAQLLKNRPTKSVANYTSYSSTHQD